MGPQVARDTANDHQDVDQNRLEDALAIKVRDDTAGNGHREMGYSHGGRRIAQQSFCFMELQS